jgi:hypothetical protein
MAELIGLRIISSAGLLKNFWFRKRCGRWLLITAKETSCSTQILSLLSKGLLAQTLCFVHTQ